MDLEGLTQEEQLAKQDYWLNKQSEKIVELEGLLRHSLDMGLGFAAVLSVTGRVDVSYATYQKMMDLKTTIHISTDPETNTQSFFAGPPVKEIDVDLEE